MKPIFTTIVLAFACSASAQVIGPYRALKPIMKDPRSNPSPPTQSPPASPPAQPVTYYQQPAKPVEIVAKIDAGLAASKITILGRVEGIKGTMYVTNLSEHAVAPTAKFAICNDKGIVLGSATKSSGELSPGGVAKIEVTTANLSAVDFKLVQLTGDKKN